MTFDPKPSGPIDIQEINSRASVFMKRGIRLLNDARPEAIVEALDCFERALELRRRLPVESTPVLGYDLAACLMNRADALTRLKRAPEALLDQDEAIALLRRLPLDADPRFPRRLAIAYQNRGLALQASEGRPAEEAIAAFGDALAILEAHPVVPEPDRRYLMAAVYTNIAYAQASEESTGSVARSRDAVSRALGLVADLERRDANAAEVGMKARHFLCQLIAKDLAPQPAAATPVPEAVHDATDAAEDGLNLARHWEAQGYSGFREIASDLFRFGALVYQTYQPQFLDEFVQENVQSTFWKQT